VVVTITIPHWDNMALQVKIFTELFNNRFLCQGSPDVWFSLVRFVGMPLPVVFSVVGIVFCLLKVSGVSWKGLEKARHLFGSFGLVRVKRI